MTDIIAKYKNGDTVVTLYADGTKQRDISNGSFAEYPETLDVKITNWCDAKCHFCHENSTTRGKHGDLQPTIDLLKQLPKGSEIAIGGGHPLSHPEFDNFVKELSSHGIICNVTINEFHFKNELNRIENLVSDGLIYGVGYSYSSIPCEWDYEHLVSHVIIGVTSYFDLDNIIAGNNKKVLLLGFKKKTGRGDIFYRKNNELVDKKINQWYAGLFNAVSKAHISFDNNAIAQLKPSRLFNNRDDYDSFFMGDDGSYSMYIDAVKQEFSVSSTGVDRHQYKDSLAYMFQMVQNKSY